LRANKSQSMKPNENNFAFICFHEFLRNGTFQRVTGEKIRKMSLRPNSRHRLWLTRPNSFLHAPLDKV
jgi:hypothetical protein